MVPVLVHLQLVFPSISCHFLIHDVAARVIGISDVTCPDAGPNSSWVTFLKRGRRSSTAEDIRRTAQSCLLLLPSLKFSPSGLLFKPVLSFLSTNDWKVKRAEGVALIVDAPYAEAELELLRHRTQPRKCSSSPQFEPASNVSDIRSSSLFFNTSLNG